MHPKTQRFQDALIMVKAGLSYEQVDTSTKVRSPAQPQAERSFKMACLRGEDDGRVLKYVTEDEPKRARQINAYLRLEAYLHLALASS